MDLPQGQSLRFVKTLAIGPILALLAVGVLLGHDVMRSWEHLMACAAGAVVGVVTGQRRYLKQYVRADPAHHAIVVVRSLVEYRILIILITVRGAAVHDQLPVVGWLSLLVSFLLSVVVFEAVARAWFSYRRYQADVSGG